MLGSSVLLGPPCIASSKGWLEHFVTACKLLRAPRFCSELALRTT